MKSTRPLDTHEIRKVADCFDGTFKTHNRRRSRKTHLVSATCLIIEFLCRRELRFPTPVAAPLRRGQSAVTEGTH